MLCCRDGSFYTGAAKDLAARCRQHEAGTASRYTRGRRPVRLVWWRRVRTWNHALRTEYRVKQLTREDKGRLVAGASWRIDRRPRVAR
jgi:putative endonuclease